MIYIIELKLIVIITAQYLIRPMPQNTQNIAYIEITEIDGCQQYSVKLTNKKSVI